MVQGLLRPRVHPDSHPLLVQGLELLAEVRVQRPNGLDGVAHQVLVQEVVAPALPLLCFVVCDPA